MLLLGPAFLALAILEIGWGLVGAWLGPAADPLQLAAASFALWHICGYRGALKERDPDLGSALQLGLAMWGPIFGGIFLRPDIGFGPSGVAGALLGLVLTGVFGFSAMKIGKRYKGHPLSLVLAGVGALGVVARLVFLSLR
jgi:hypothetical protein